MLKITVIGNFNPVDSKEGYSGWKDCSIPHSIADALEPFYEIERLDTSHVEPGEWAMSVVLGKEYPRGHILFIVQPHFVFRVVDIPDPKIIYFHIDGPSSVPSMATTFVIKIWCGIGRHDYELSEKQHTILPFVDPNFFDSTRDKIHMVSHIDRSIPFPEYKDRMEQSCYLIVNAHHWLSKRVFQAIACKTIPIVFTTHRKECYEDREITSNYLIFRNYNDPFTPPTTYNREMADHAYEWLLAHHTASHRVEEFKTIINYVSSLPL